MGIFGIKPTGRDIVPVGLRNTGFEAATDGSKSVLDKYLNQLIFETQTDHIWGTEAQAKLAEPEATFYTDASGNPLDASDAAVTFNHDDRIVMVHDVSLTANLVIDGGGRRLDLRTDRGLTLDLVSTFKVVLNNSDNSIVLLNTNGDVLNSLQDNTSGSNVSINGVSTSIPNNFISKPVRDLGLKVKNNTTNPDFQVDISFKSITLYDPDGNSVTDSLLTPTTYDISLGISSGGSRAEDVVSEGSASEQSNTWYYLHRYQDSSGVKGLIFSTNPVWEDISVNDKPSGIIFNRMIGFARNNASSNFSKFIIVGNRVSIEADSPSNMASNGVDDVWVQVDISGVVPVGANRAGGFTRNINDESNWIAPVNTNAFALNSGFSTPGSIGSLPGRSSYLTYWECDIEEEQTLYIAQSAGSSEWCLTRFWFDL